MKKKSSAKWFVFFKPFLVDGYLAAATIAINLIVIFTFSTLWPFFLFICVCVCVLLSQQKKLPGFFILIIIIECDGVCGCIFSSFSAISFNSIHSFIVFFGRNTQTKKNDEILCWLMMMMMILPCPFPSVHFSAQVWILFHCYLSICFCLSVCFHNHHHHYYYHSIYRTTYFFL